MKKVLIVALLFAFTTAQVFAGEGMWLPLLLKSLNEKEMKSLGMKMSAEDIYSVNKGSLKDAIVHFGGFCTGEVISTKGLVLTNHHCGYGQIQSHSSIQNNYLEEGFWAKTLQDELPNEGLFVSFIVRIEDVTDFALQGVDDSMSERERQSVIDRNLNGVKGSTALESYQEVSVKPFFDGNQYFLFVTESYKDIRLVGAPPSSIGKFGADTDNWVWPRHTGDFAMFRIYAGKDNKPAEYAADNVPFQPRHSLPISLDGVATGDFTMVFGFPGRTDQYIPVSAMKMRVNDLNPIRIRIRDQSLAVLDAAMRKDPAARIQYASKQARIANAHKKWIGENLGIKTTKGIEKKQLLEAEFMARVKADTALEASYGTLLADMDKLYAKLTPYARAKDYVDEIAYRNLELFSLVNTLQGLARIYENSGMAGVQGRLTRVQAFLQDFYKDYNSEVDRAIFTRLMPLYFNEMPPAYLSQFVVDQITFAGKDYESLALMIYEKSILTKGKMVMQALDENPEAFLKGLQGDYAMQFATAMTDTHKANVQPKYTEYMEQLAPLQRRYMEALMTVFPERTFYPDANSTLRVTYGQVEGYQPDADTKYEPVTYLSGVIAKYVPGDYEFDLPARLRELHAKRDYGQYADATGDVPVCFIGSNHTTGGNSGSPAIDAWGNLVGLNFDRVWEGTMSDINYDRSICRNIMVDARYILFVVDKFAGAGHLLEEMNLVRPKTATKKPADTNKKAPKGAERKAKQRSKN